MTFEESIQQVKEEMIRDLATLVSHPSVQGEAVEGCPFGQENAACLEDALKILQRCGMKTVNLENYCGYGEIGEGDEVIAILAHLDVVPCGEGWNSDPFTLTQKDGIFYGRGVSDDKGAVIASAYALRLLKESGFPLKKRIRLILGCNEESGSACLAHYVKKEGHADYGFTPDAVFPGVFGEKGMIQASFCVPTVAIGNIQGGLAPNIVCSHCRMDVREEGIDIDILQNELIQRGCQVTLTHENKFLHLEVQGIAAHASTPELGVNAISHTLAALAKAGLEDPAVTYYNEKIGTCVHGEGLGLDVADEYGRLTCNNGMISLQEGKLCGTLDIRFPVTMNAADLSGRLVAAGQTEQGSITVNSTVNPLFYPKDSALVQALLKAYRTVTKDEDSEPVTMGGGTYAKGMKNCIAFGCEFKDEDNHIHDANECLKEEDLWLQTKIYMEAVKNLLELSD